MADKDGPPSAWSGVKNFDPNDPVTYSAGHAGPAPWRNGESLNDYNSRVKDASDSKGGILAWIASLFE